MEQPNNDTHVIMTTGVRQRLEQYKLECQKKKEFNLKKEQIQVGILDDSMTDIQKYQHSPSKYQKPKFEGSGINIDEYRIEFEGSNNSNSNSNIHITERPGPNNNNNNNPLSKKQKAQLKKDEEEARAKANLGQLLERTDAYSLTPNNNGSSNNNNNNSSSNNNSSKTSRKTPFTDLRRRYMEAVTKLKPDAVTTIDSTSSSIKAASTRRILKERKMQYATLQSSWDTYEQAAQDKPKIRSKQDKQDEEQMAKLEDDVNQQWTGYAERVAQVMKDQDFEHDEDDDDLDYWIAEAKRLRALAEARKKQRADKIKKTEEQEEEEYWIQEAIKLKNANNGVKPNGSTSANPIPDENDDEEEEPVRRNKNNGRSLRPGMMRGNSFDGSDEFNHQSNNDNNNGEEEGEDSYNDLEIDNDAENHQPTRRGGRRPGSNRIQPDGSFRRLGRDGRVEDWTDSEDEDEDGSGEKKRRNGGGNSMRPGMMRGNSFDGLEDMQQRPNDNDDEGDKAKQSHRVGPDGRIILSDSEDDDDDEDDKAQDNTETANDESNNALDDEKVAEATTTDAATTTKKKKKKPVELIEDEPLECPTTPRNPDGTLWSNPLKAWANKPKKIKEIGAQVIVKVPGKTDCWRKTRHNFIMDNAPFYWHKVTGDFQVIVKVSGTFSKMYDKAGLMIREDEENWILSGMELFNDKMNHSTCVTRDYTDWSLATLPENAEKAGIWFCLKRMGNAYESFYSVDGRVWIQTRQGLFSDKPILKVGIVCACPMGDPYKAVFEYYRVQQI